MQGAKIQAQGISCLSNAKQLGLGVLMYVQDYDERFPRKSDSFKSPILPYVKNEDIFRCVLDAKGVLSYRFNLRLANLSLAAIERPADTILLYEGKNEKPEYRHNGRAAIVLADGHAKLMTPAEVARCTWYPSPKPAAQHQR
jgi:prepilin-type processing-associated H-X9-DG protein